MCGNFGAIIFSHTAQDLALQLLRLMLSITQVRGAQSAGLVTYLGSVGLRVRVVNGKRTDLARLLIAKTARTLRGRTELPQLYQGHTRFATSSRSVLSGCHPHQWMPRATQTHWRHVGGSAFVCERANAEAFVTHNGDLDFFVVHGQTYALGDLRRLLQTLLGRPAPAEVDSACLAGLLDLLRTRGCWLASVRYGYLYGALATAGHLSALLALGDSGATSGALAQLAAAFEAEWVALLAELAQQQSSPHDGEGREETDVAKRRLAELQWVEARMVRRLRERWEAGAFGSLALLLHGVNDAVGSLRRLAESTVHAFLHGDLIP